MGSDSFLISKESLGIAGASGVADKVGVEGGGVMVIIGSGLELDVLLAVEHPLTRRIAIIAANNRGLIPAPG